MQHFNSMRFLYGEVVKFDISIHLKRWADHMNDPFRCKSFILIPVLDLFQECHNNLLQHKYLMSPIYGIAEKHSVEREFGVSQFSWIVKLSLCTMSEINGTLLAASHPTQGYVFIRNYSPTSLQASITYHQLKISQIIRH